MGMSERSEISVSALSFSAHDRRSRPFISKSDRQKWVRLVISKADVETRLVALNEAVFEHQSIHFSRNFDPFHRSGCRYHLHCSRVKISRVLKITIEAIPQTLSLSDVNDPTVAVLELVAPWKVRD
jgi:hypothetical protein